MSKIEIEESVLTDLQNDSARLTAELTAAKAGLVDVEVHKRTAAELAAKLQATDTSLKSAVAERDTFKTKAAELEGNVVKLTNDGRERDFLDALSAEAPHADRKVLRGLVFEAAEKGLVERYPTDPKAAAKAAFEKLKAEAPAAFTGKGVTLGGTSANGTAPARRQHIL
jgi:hypothetical protein